MGARANSSTIDVRNLYRREDVRAELQILRRRIAARLEKHLEEQGIGKDQPARLFTETHLPPACYACWSFNGQLEAIGEALRMFGGRTEGR